MNWRKSTFSDNGGVSCVETASRNGQVMIRDTTNRDGFTLAFGAGVWAAFLTSLR